MKVNTKAIEKEFCKDCKHYKYTNDEKIFVEQEKMCWNPEGECKELYQLYIKKAKELENE